MKKLSLACLLAVAALATLAPTAGLGQEAAAPAAAAPALAAEPAAPAAVPAEPAKAKAEPAVPAVRVIDPSANASDALVSMNFDETPLADVIKAFRDATGANIISSGTNLQGTISVRLDNVPWRKGLNSILEPQGLQLSEQPPSSGIYVVTTKSFEIPLTTQTFSLENAKADEVAKLFTSTLGKSGVGTATAFPAANLVIVTATEQQLAECEKIIKSVDKPRTQVYIEARFAELTAGATRELGIDWFKSTLNDDHGLTIVNSSPIDRPDDAGNFHSGLIYGHNYQRYTGLLTPDDFSTTLHMFDQLNNVSIFSNPKIIVANEETATVDMTTKEPNLEVTFTAATTVNGSDSLSTKLALIPGKDEPFVGEAFYSYGITLKVTPRVNPSGLITVQIEPAISDKDVDQGEDGYFTIPGVAANMPAAKFPIIKMQRLKTVFSMQSGTTAVIGGLSRTTERNTDSGIPFLRELPWIGPHLFGWKNHRKEQKEIVIFVTVGIADPVALKEDVGMPKNAILGRDILSGKTKEPGDRTIEEILSLKTPERARKAKPAADEPEAAAPAPAQPVQQSASAPAPAPAAAAEKPAQSSASPAAMEPLLKNP